MRAAAVAAPRWRRRRAEGGSCRGEPKWLVSRCRSAGDTSHPSLLGRFAGLCTSPQVTRLGGGRIGVSMRHGTCTGTPLH